MTDLETNVTNHYNLSTPYPVAWPAELDQSDDEEYPSGTGGGVRRSRSRYSALERSASDRRTTIPGSQRTGDGRANLVQKDEPDPLGGMDSVVRALKQRRLPVEEDARLRNKFLLSSTTFSPALFLSQTHPDASTQSLLQGLEYLTKSIDQKSASLKVLVESNFERFVRAKATIDNVYTEMRNQGMEEDPNLSARHSRQVSRSSGHFRNFSSGSAAGGPASTSSTISKNALRKESEYGVQGIKGPLLEVSQKAQDVWGPALGGRERESNLKSIVEEVEKEQQLYELGARLSRSIKQKDYEAIVLQYNSARRYSAEAKTMAEFVASGGHALTDDQVYRILITGRMWTDVESQIKTFQREIWRRLSNAQSLQPHPGASQAEEHMELIGVLLELGVEDNPIWVWLLSRYDYLKTKITAVSDRSKVEIEILRRRLAQTEKPTPQTTASYLRQAGKEGSTSIDTEQITEMWETVLTYMTKLLSKDSGLLGEVVDFWQSTQSFIDGHKQTSLPIGYDGQSKKHHRLSDAGIRDLQNGALDLVNIIRESVFALFADQPTEDISSLFSPLPQTSPNTPLSAVFSPTEGRLGRIDTNMIPPPSPRKGEVWEDFAFWPPHSNSLSTTHYLSKILVLVGTAASTMIELGPITTSSSAQEKIKAMVGGARERCVRVVCDAWNKDAESCKGLEDWTRAPDRRDQTKMPAHFMAFERTILLGMQKIVYYSDANTGSSNVVSAPPSKLLQIVKTQFVASIYKALSGMVENAERQITHDAEDWIVVTNDDLDFSSSNAPIAADAVDASSRNVRMLLTLSNLKALKIDLVPQLVNLFESSFSVKLTDESKTIRDVLGQIDAKLFQSYTRPTVTTLTKTIKEGINSPDWVPSTSKPDQIKPYVYTVLLTLVMVHTEISTTVSTPGAFGATATTTSTSALVIEILSFLLEKVSEALLNAFKERKPAHYTLPALMQATLDTEFISQTMAQYATKKATDVQSEIYMELDRRTNNDSRAQLQKELGEMRIVLKKLREGSRGSFGCFRKVRPERKATG